MHPYKGYRLGYIPMSDKEMRVHNEQLQSLYRLLYRLHLTEVTYSEPGDLMRRGSGSNSSRLSYSGSILYSTDI